MKKRENHANDLVSIVRTDTCTPGTWLDTGGWVMEGEPSVWNYAMSGKWEDTPWNDYAPFDSGQVFDVNPDDLAWPSGWNIYKGLSPFNQRIYTGPPVPPSSCTSVNAPPTNISSK
jgi:hypothetical protein